MKYGGGGFLEFNVPAGEIISIELIPFTGGEHAKFPSETVPVIEAGNVTPAAILPLKRLSDEAQPPIICSECIDRPSGVRSPLPIGSYRRSGASAAEKAPTPLTFIDFNGAVAVDDSRDFTAQPPNFAPLLWCLC